LIKNKLFGGYYENKVVFLTGHTGFQGAWLSLWLSLLGAKVIGYSLPPPTNPSLFNLLSLNKTITSVIGDINNRTKLLSTLLKYKPDIVIHFAAQSLVRESYEKPIETLTTNIIGTANVLESVKEISTVKNCLIMTSDKAYENKEQNYAYKENDSMGGYDPYSASKGAAELITSSYRRSFFNQKNSPGIATIRSGNVIGGGDWAKDRIIPDCIRSLLSDKKIILRNPRAIRPWQYVLESLSGLLLIGSKLYMNPQKFGTAWNIGPLTFGDTSVKDIANKIVKKWGVGKITIKKHNLHEAKNLKLNVTKISTLLKWKPAYSINKSVDETIEWYLNYNENKRHVSDFTISQLENYITTSKQMKICWTK
jgi:CDP-glucose 4,6-dehydratase